MSVARKVPFRSRGLERCVLCALPPKLCICDGLPLLLVQTPVRLVIHHVEQKKSTNTGRLAVRILDLADVRIRGERDAPPRVPTGEPHLVLYPDGATRELCASDRGTRIVVPDGNWGQARRMINRDPDVIGGEIVSLPPGGRPSRYGLRRSPRSNTLCTFEAIARAMGVVEGEAVEAQMLEVLDRFLVASRIVRGSGKDGTRLPE